jgi:hypothetical protein
MLREGHLEICGREEVTPQFKDRKAQEADFMKIIKPSHQIHSTRKNAINE